MTILWVVFWLIAGTPEVVFSGEWNFWAGALVTCAALDLNGART